MIDKDKPPHGNYSSSSKKINSRRPSTALVLRFDFAGKSTHERKGRQHRLMDYGRDMRRRQRKDYGNSLLSSRIMRPLYVESVLSVIARTIDAR